MSALVRSAKTLVTRARPLRATDAALSGEATADANAAWSLDDARITGPMADLVSLGSDITAFLATLAPLVADPVTNRATILAQVDAYVSQAVPLLDRAARFRIPSAGWGFALGGLHDAFAALIAQVSGAGGPLERQAGRLRRARRRLRRAARRHPGRCPVQRAAGGADAADRRTRTACPRPRALLRTALDAERAAFVARRDQFAAVQQTGSTSFSGTLATLTGLLPVTDIGPGRFRCHRAR